VTIIYAPPVDQQKKNVASWASSKTTGNTTVLSFTDAHSQGAPAISQFQGWSDMAGGMKDASAVLSKVPNPYVQAAGAALGIISGLLGSSTSTQTNSTSVTKQNTLTVTMASQDTVATNPTGGGPGSGDVLYFLKNKECQSVLVRIRRPHSAGVARMG